jgi:8-oxo-dGTP pyrophosphatase MutT (NUDIX family)
VIGLDAVRRALRGHRPRSAATPGALPAAVALVLLETGQGLEALFIRRAVRAGDPWSGQVALPGGRRAASDPDLLATAIRETREETGVELSESERLGALDDLHPQTPTLPPVVVRPFVFALVRRPALVPSSEVERAFWLPLARLAAADARRSVTLTVRGEARAFAAYLADDELIWGMTERILTPFLRRIGLLDEE